MASVHFTENLKRHIECPAVSAEGETVREVLANVFSQNPKLGCYVLDNQGRLRKHMTIAVDGKLISDRDKLSDTVESDAKIYVMQALSGG